LSVLVDPAFNLFSLNGGGLNAGFVLFNGAASPSTVSLTVPGSNSQYATIYWNPNSNPAGVVYGAISATPFPILPDDAAFIPLACVLLTTGQSQVQANNISDIRSFWNFGPVRYDNITLNSTVTVNCAGARSVDLNLHASGASANLTLSNLQVGIPLQIIWRGSANTIVFAINTPGGVAYTTRTKTAGNSTGFTTFTLLGNGLTAGTDALFRADTYYRGTTPFWDAPFQ
jgi:hypothetical protein